MPAKPMPILGGGPGGDPSGWAEPAADRFGPGRSAQATCYPTTG